MREKQRERSKKRQRGDNGDRETETGDRDKRERRTPEIVVGFELLASKVVSYGCILADVIDLIIIEAHPDQGTARYREETHEPLYEDRSDKEQTTPQKLSPIERIHAAATRQHLLL